MGCDNRSESTEQQPQVGPGQTGSIGNPINEGVEHQEDIGIEYEGGYDLDQDCRNSMNRLMENNRWNDGRVKRSKVARLLNDLGCTKPDGSSFDRADIPKF
jgi:hypothetical protein